MCFFKSKLYKFIATGSVRILGFVLVLVSVTMVCGCSDNATSDTDDPAKVVTMSGPVRGIVGAKSRSFLGIPYAAAPIGSLRWKTPQPPQPWDTPLDATKLGNPCSQKGGIISPPGTPSEDCLTINVWTPMPVPTNAPVMVWIHGGGFTSGGSSSELSNGQQLAEHKGVVVVSFNYRLGPLGFLAHPSLGSPSGNYGFLDQQAALAWVQENIVAFGGDSKEVTVFGESAGAFSVCTHLVAPGSKGLFARAMMESGACSWGYLTLAEAETQGEQLAKAVGCEAGSGDVAACLRSKSIDVILEALDHKFANSLGDGASWSPIIDAIHLTGQPLHLLKAGAFQKVPVLLGTNEDEGTLFVLASGQVLVSKSSYKSRIKNYFGPENAPKVLAEYPPEAYDSPAKALADLVGDVVFTCNSRAAARALSSSGGATYLYRFTRVPTNVSLPYLGCHHAAEIPFVFHTPRKPFDSDEDVLSETMQDYWTRFARTGNPNGQGSLMWPAYRKETDQHITLDLTVAANQHLKQAKCDFWDTLLFQ